MSGIPTAELTGVWLNLATGHTDTRCAGLSWTPIDGVWCGIDPKATSTQERVCVYLCENNWMQRMALQKKHPFASWYNPSSDYAQGMPIVEYMMRQGMRVECASETTFTAYWPGKDVRATGGSLMVAALRLRAMSSFGSAFDTTSISAKPA